MSKQNPEATAGDMRSEADVKDLLASIDAALRRRSPIDQQRIRQVLLQALGDGRGYNYPKDLTIEALYVWDLISRAIYFDIQFALNENQASCHLPWEERSADCIEYLINDPNSIFAAWNASRLIELAFALERTGCWSDSISRWCQTVLDRSKSSQNHRCRAAEAVARRNSQSEQKLLIWQLRKMERLSLSEIGERLRITDYSVRIGISEGGELQARRLAVRNPVVPTDDRAAPVSAEVATVSW